MKQSAKFKWQVNTQLGECEMIGALKDNTQIVGFASTMPEKDSTYIVSL